MDESDRAASRWRCTCSDPVWQHVARSDKLRNISRRAVSLNNRRESVCEQNWVSPESAVSSFCTHSLPVRTSQSSPHGPELAPVRGPPPCTVCSSIRYVITSITESEARPQQAAALPHVWMFHTNVSGSRFCSRRQTEDLSLHISDSFIHLWSQTSESTQRQVRWKKQRWALMKN